MQVGFKEMMRQITSAKQKPLSTETPNDYLLDNSLYVILRPLESDIDVDVRFHSI